MNGLNIENAESESAVNARMRRIDIFKAFLFWNYMDSQQDISLLKLKMVEIGVDTGHFSSALLAAFPNCSLQLIDPWKLSTTESNAIHGSHNTTQSNLDEKYLHVKNKFASESRVSIFRGTAREFHSESPNYFADVIYIDGDHSFLNCHEDLVISDSMNKPGSLVILDDYMWQPNHRWGVVQAINVFIGSNPQRYMVHGKVDGQVSIIRLE